LVLARFFAEVRSDQLDLRDLIKAGLLVGVPLVLILKQPDLGTALVLMPMLVVGAFLAGLQWQHAAVFSLAGILLVGAVFYPPVSRHILKPYQAGTKSLLSCTLKRTPRVPAINSCNRRLPWVPAVSGQRVPHGSQNQLGYIPVRYSDFIMSAWAEEQGFKGVLLALGLYMALLLRLVQNAQRAKDRAECFWSWRRSGAGVHVLVNVAMVHRRDAGNRHPVTVNELRGFRHVICFPGDWPGDECPASPLRQLTKLPVPRDVSASPERTGKEFALGIVDPSMAGSQLRRILE